MHRPRRSAWRPTIFTAPITLSSRANGHSSRATSVDEHVAHLDWPFFEARNGELARALDAWAGSHLVDDHGADVDSACQSLVAQLGAAGWLRYAVGGTAY